MENISFLNKRILYIIYILPFLFLSCQKDGKKILDISGQWTVQLDSLDVGAEKGWQNSAFEEVIILPGTTDDAGIGNPNTLSPALEKPQLLHLIRKNSYIGKAWYTREISVPQDWIGKEYILSLERVIWQTDVWIDGVKLPQTNNSLISSHNFNLTDFLKPGQTQRITICVDNRKKMDVSYKNLAHAYTDETQIIWNGIIGKMEIEAIDPLHIIDLQVFPDIATNKTKVKISLNNNSGKDLNGKLSVQALLKKTNKKCPVVTRGDIHIVKGNSLVEIEYDMGEDVQYWSEFAPNVYELEACIKTPDHSSSKTVNFGMRAFEKKGARLTINNHPVFLRGTLECNVFPLTGYPPMTKDGWQKVFDAAKEWGLNHLRFHSWCPPKAAFEVADEMGFYLQVELPLWSLTVGHDSLTTEYLYAEGHRILKEYGNHPSFCMFSMGNELQGDMSLLPKLVKEFKNIDQRHLYTTTSFTFEKGYGVWPDPEDEYFVTQWTNKGWVRGQGVFNSQYPSFDKNFRKAIEGMEVPLITHEVGQYAVYPNLKEIEKYTGVLLPLNFIAVKNDLEQKDMLHKADSYTKASGKLAAILYKEEIERAMKTPGISGFQLLDLHDFPGQGTALVGLLDAFWENKGATTPAEFKYACNDIVPLLNFGKPTFFNDENFKATLDISNYSAESLLNQSVQWQIMKDKVVVYSGKTNSNIELGYNDGLLNIDVPLTDIKDASRLVVEVTLEGTEYKNQWDIWVYPKALSIEYGNVKYTRSMDEAYRLLDKGETVLLNPDWKNIKGIEGKFVPVFWSPVHFPKQAATMGILCDPQHEALAGFPTEMHSNWQWWDLNINSTTMIIDDIQNVEPIVEVIDNFANNRKLSMIFEGKVGNGKLVVASCDLQKDLENRPVAKQMLYSLLNYMNSSRFGPKEIKNPENLKNILTKDQVIRQTATSIY